jgi:predicted nucleotidyltransferase component of viral defense system
MDKIARMNQSDRSELFGETAAIMAIPEAIVEKDFWVCWILRYLFNASSLSKDIIFKGGTSLSKAFGIIERFSEDIDLILNWELLGIEKDEPWIDRSKNQQDRYNKVVNEKAQRYIAETIIETLRNGQVGG